VWLSFNLSIDSHLLSRLSRESFDHVLDLIKSDPVFQSTGKKPQRPVKYQLAAFLCHVGGEDAAKTGDITSIAEGTSYLYIPRVTRALRNLRSSFLAWPGPERREYLKDAMGEWGFPGCIGICDGTFLRLLHKPWKQGWSYWCRKKYYAVSI
jgi:hypothetical protein